MSTCTTRRLVVASVPSGHPYVRNLGPLDPRQPAPVRLVDPDPDDVSRAAGVRWWPPPMLERSWAAAHAFDLMHVHFGFDDRTPSQLRELVEELRASGRALVLTVHDLHSPHQEDPAQLRAQLDVLVPAADRVITLTAGAAREIFEHWRCEAAVVPHPHLVDLTTMERVRRHREGVVRSRPRVGLAVKDLRTNTDPVRLLPALVELTRRGHEVVLTMHRELHDRPVGHRQVEAVAALTRASQEHGLELVVHDPFDDEALWRWVAALDVALLPYRFGTHSGWLEMAHDLGTSVVAPAFGHYDDQGADATYVADADVVDHDSVVDAVERAVSERAATGLPGLDARGRRRQRAFVAEAHDRIYREALHPRSPR